MAAPASAQRFSIGFRDAKGNVSRMRVVLGDTTPTTVNADLATLIGHLQAISNAHVYATGNPAPSAGRIYGSTGEYDTVEDKAVLTFTDPLGNLHRYQVPAPKTAIFLADQETVNPANVALASVITDFGTFTYGNYTDTAAQVYVGGVRARRKMQRKLNIFVKDPSLTEPAE